MSLVYLKQTCYRESLLLVYATHEIANLISKLNFYKLIPYPMDNSLSGRRGPARQTSEKDVLCLHRLGRPSTLHSPDGVSYFLPV